MDNKIQDYLDKKYWFNKQKFANVSYLTILRRVVKDDWYDLFPHLFARENWEYETNYRLVAFLRDENQKFLPAYQLANPSLIIADINASCAFSGRWIRDWWRTKWFDRKKQLRNLFQERLHLDDWGGWLEENRQDQDFLAAFSIEELQLIYAWSMAFSQIYFLDQVFYGRYSTRAWFDHPNVLRRKEVQWYLLHLLQPVD